MTLTNKPCNKYNNGHNMVEIKWDGKLRLIDLDNNSYFILRGQLLDLLQFRNYLKADDFEIRKLSDDINIQSGWIDNETRYDYTFYGEINFIFFVNLKEWYKKVVDAIFIESEGVMYFLEHSDEK